MITIYSKKNATPHSANLASNKVGLNWYGAARASFWQTRF
jgi:hypothetical protein